MPGMTYNHSPISLREGHVFLDGLEIFDCVKCEVKATPDTWTGRLLGERTPSTRWLGVSISGTMTRRRTTGWTKTALRRYIDEGITPELTIQGIMDDPNSDYYAENGADTVTVVGCVPTGDLNLLMLDSEGEILEDELNFNAKNIL